jgi:MoxR-like ATPase
VSVEGRTYTLPDPFMVIATQNPIEHAGVNDLPEAQLD